MCCLVVLDSVTSTPQWIRQPRPCDADLRDAWEQENNKDDLKIDLQGLERQFWLGTEAGRLKCYISQGKPMIGGGWISAQRENGCGKRLDRHLLVRVGREEDGVNSLRQKFAALARTLQATPTGIDLLYLCDSETTLDKKSWWIGRGPRTTLAGDCKC